MDQASLTPLASAAAIADTVLAPQAQQVDIDGSIPASHFAALADAGLFGILGPAAAGGSDVSLSDTRRIMAHVAGGCGNTFFVWAQHHGVVRLLRSSTNGAMRSTLLAALCAGEQIAGVAFAHARRVGSPPLRATRETRGWRLDGFAPWTTSWGIAHHFAIAAETDDGQLVWSMVSPSATDAIGGIEPRPLPLPVLGATGTVALDVDGCRVSDDQVIQIVDADEWRAADRRNASLGQTGVLGVAARAITLLGDAARTEHDPALEAVAGLDAELARCWSGDTDLLALIAELDTDGIAEASAHRARCLRLGQRATTALLAASGGGGMDLRHPAQRLAREAMFYVIQAQTVDGRRATLEHIAS